MDITKIDKNFKVETNIERDGLKFYDIDDSPFKIYGVFRENDRYVRMPSSIAKGVSDSVYTLCTHTAGGRVRFVTDSPYIAVHLKLNSAYKMPHFAFSGSVGCDLYSGSRYIGTFMPRVDVQKEYENIIDLPLGGEHEYTINMPLYSGIDKMYVGIKNGCVLKAANGYKHTKPIVYYGSSITQGGCASRPGNAYQSIVSRELDCDFINLGFSGSAKAEAAMADYIAGLDMLAFVYDYDHNATTVQEYKSTHERMFKIIREKNPNLPILMMTRPKYHLSAQEKERIDVMMNTYNNAVAAGDKKVYFIKGPDLLSESVREAALVDNCHPNDAGFVSMAQAVLEKLKQILKT